MKHALCALGMLGGLTALALPALPAQASPSDPDAHASGTSIKPTVPAARSIRFAKGGQQDPEDPADPALTARTTHYGDCSGNVSAAWYRGANLLTVDGNVTNSARFSDCKLKYTIRWYSGQYEVGSQSNDLPTACGTWDPTCRPSAGATWVKQTAVAPVVVGQVDRISAEITTR